MHIAPSGPYSWRTGPTVPALVFRPLPRGLRDRLYRLLARNRLRWFGQLAVWYRPDAAHADRFFK